MAPSPVLDAPSGQHATGNALVLVGGVGHFAYEQVDATGKTLLDTYSELVRAIHVDGLGAICPESLP